MADELNFEHGEQTWQQEHGLDHDTNMEKFGSVQDLAKSYNELQTSMSRSIRVPSEDAGEEAMEKFYERLTGIEGVMRTPEGYEAPPADAEAYRFNDIDGVEVDKDVQAALKAFSKENGLTQTQADGVYKFIGERIASEVSAASERNELGMQELRNEWGLAADQKMQAAKNVTMLLNDRIPGLTEMVDSLSSIGHDNTGIRLMAAVADMLGEAGLTPASHRTMMTPNEASERLQELRNNPEYQDLQEGTKAYSEFHKKRRELIQAGARVSLVEGGY